MSHPEHNESAAAIVSRLRAVTGAGNDSDLARRLGVSRDQVSKWQARDSRPYPICLQMARDRGVSLDWLLTGEGQMRREAPVGVAEADHQYGEGTAKVETQDPPDLAEIIAALRSWHAAASEEDRIWMRVQIRRAIPEIEEHIRSIQSHGHSN